MIRRSVTERASLRESRQKQKAFLQTGLAKFTDVGWCTRENLTVLEHIWGPPPLDLALLSVIE